MSSVAPSLMPSFQLARLWLTTAVSWMTHQAHQEVAAFLRAPALLTDPQPLVGLQYSLGGRIWLDLSSCLSLDVF